MRLSSRTRSRARRARSTSCSATISACRRVDLGTGHLDRLAGQRDLALALGDLERLAAADFELLLRTLALDAVALDRELPGDLFALGLLADADLGDFEDAAAGDLALLDLFFVDDAGLGERALLGDAGLLGRLAGGDLRLARLLLAERPFAGKLGALDGAADLDLALLLEAGVFALALDLEHAALGFQVLVADLDHRLLFDLVTHLAARLDRLGQLWSDPRRRRRWTDRRIRGWSGRHRPARRSRARAR